MTENYASGTEKKREEAGGVGVGGDNRLSRKMPNVLEVGWVGMGAE